jgi:hypothetical protein
MQKQVDLFRRKRRTRGSVAWARACQTPGLFSLAQWLDISEGGSRGHGSTTYPRYIL